MIRAIVSDFGGVLTSPLIEGFLAYQEQTGVTPEDLGKAMARAQEREGEHPLFQLERGEISEEEFGRRLQDTLPENFDLRHLREVYFERLRSNAPMIDFMRELRGRGLRMALCTNNVREWEPLWRAKLPELDEIFEVVVDSAFVGARKPERRIFELTLERLGEGVTFWECLLVDDVEVNCDRARELGMKAVRFEETEQTIAAIERELG
ncbi:MAG TPA: HAD family phosphatase [Thermoleophilaceae bacterium]|nr:HAD family phosphatase [Thermoleophilaceae bacterium]